MCDFFFVFVKIREWSSERKRNVYVCFVHEKMGDKIFIYIKSFGL